LEQEPPHRRPRGAARSDEPLQQYRLYFLESFDRLISYSHEFEARDDEHAVKISEAWLEGRRAELWNGTRKVRKWGNDR